MICGCGCQAAQTLPLIGGSEFLTALFCLAPLAGALTVIWLTRP